MQTCLRAGGRGERLGSLALEWDVELARWPAVQVLWLLSPGVCIGVGAWNTGRGGYMQQRDISRGWLQGRPCPWLAQKGLLMDSGDTSSWGHHSPWSTPSDNSTSETKPLTNAEPSTLTLPSCLQGTHPPPLLFSFSKMPLWEWRTLFYTEPRGVCPCPVPQTPRPVVSHVRARSTYRGWGCPAQGDSRLQVSGQA